MSVEIVSICSEVYRPLAELTVDVNKKVYCERHGYKLHDIRVLETSDRIAGYERIEIILGLMASAEAVEWYWAMGVDTMIMNFARRLEEFADPQFHFIIAGDFNGLNADSYLVRNSHEGRCWLEFILSQRKAYAGSMFVEQSVMIDWHKREPFRDWVKVAAQNGREGINAYEMGLYCFDESSAHYLKGQWRPGDFVVHWPGLPFEKRMALAKAASDRLTGI